MNLYVNLTHLKFFCDTVACKSITEAAKMNYVTQSTVSQGIAKLELIFGVDLIYHVRQKLSVTQEGLIIYEQAQDVFKAIQNIYDRINSIGETLSGTLKFVSTNSLGMSFLAPLYKRMQARFPSLNLNFRLGNLNFIRNALRQGEAEFAIVVYDQDFSAFSKYPLKKGNFYLYQQSHAVPDEIEKNILVDHSKGMHVSALKKYLMELKGPLLRMQELAGWEVVARFTDMNMGIGFFPDYIVDHERYPSLKIHPQEIPLFTYEICAIYNKTERLSRTATAFLEEFALKEAEPDK